MVIMIIAWVVDSYWYPGLAWLAALLMLGFYELWAGMTGHKTLSAWVREQSRNFGWFMVVILVLMVVLMWHFFFQG